MIIKVVPIGEYDRRLVLLTKERGKISAFARGARKPNSRFVAATNLFCFGTFKLYQGRDSYTLAEAEITNYFEELRMDFEGAYYGMYFLEIADYYTRENNDEREMLKLLYQSLRALSVPSLSHQLVRAIYELKSVIVNGEFPGIPADKIYLPATEYTVDYIVNSSIEKLYTFTVTEEVLEELRRIADKIYKLCISTHFHSLEILNTLE
jgi:DNA repair protein RecO (recombination protein O)